MEIKQPCILRLGENISEANTVIDIIKISETNLKSIQTTALENIENLFLSIGLNKWTHDQHIESNQYSRLLKAVVEKLDLQICNLDYKKKSAKFIRPDGFSYDISANGCTCEDYTYRGRPCKHIYALAIALYETNPLKKKMYTKQITDGERTSRSSLLINTATGEALTTPSRLDGLTIVFTGTFDSYSREALEQKVRDAGGKVISSISRKTSYLVVGKAPGSKLEKAMEYGVSLIEEHALLKMIGE